MTESQHYAIITAVNNIAAYQYEINYGYVNPKLYKLLEKLAKIKNNKPALHAWAIKAKRIIATI